ncbi:MAG: hypothetical protein ACREBW_09070, partial [Candidatus Micrarchaeaceae archaeon]
MSVPWSGWFTQIMRTLNALGGVPPTPTSPAVLATAYKGNWSDIVTYYPGDESSYTGNLYRAIEESLNVVPANGTYWLLIGPLTQDALIDGAQFVRLANNHAVGNVAYNFRGVWNSGDTYVTGDEVVYGQTYWVALANSMNSAP